MIPLIITHLSTDFINKKTARKIKPLIEKLVEYDEFSILQLVFPGNEKKLFFKHNGRIAFSKSGSFQYFNKYFNTTTAISIGAYFHSCQARTIDSLFSQGFKRIHIIGNLCFLNKKESLVDRVGKDISKLPFYLNMFDSVSGYKINYFYEKKEDMKGEKEIYFWKNEEKFLSQHFLKV